MESLTHIIQKGEPMKRMYANWIAAIVVTLGVAGCGGSGSAGSGTLNVGLTDAPGDFDAVYVTIDRIAVHRADESNESNASWITVADVNGTFDLLKLQHGTTEDLGVSTIPAAKYTQMRLYLSDESNDSSMYPYGNFVVINGMAYELTVPSMVIKENNNFVMAGDGNMTMTIDFDANSSVHQADGKWVLKPVLHVKTK